MFVLVAVTGSRIGTSAVEIVPPNYARAAQLHGDSNAVTPFRHMLSCGMSL
jgi:hypothetical protein